jgi:hypothetical protein
VGRGRVAETNVASAPGAGGGGVGNGGGPGRTTGSAVSAGTVGAPLPVPDCCTRGAAGGGTGAATGAPAPTGALSGTATGGGPATTGPGRTTGAGAAGPDICAMHAGPPVGSGAAAAPGLNCKAARHNPAPAAAWMPKRSKIFNANSLAFGFRGVYPQS